MPKIELLVEKITILKDSGKRYHIPKVLFTALPGTIIGEMKANMDLLNEVLVDNRKMKNLKFHVEWDD